MNIPQRRQINLSRGFIKLNKHAYNNPSVTAFTSGCVPSLTNRVLFDHTKALLDLCVSLVFCPSGNRKFVQKHTKEYCSVLRYIMLLFIHTNVAQCGRFVYSQRRKTPRFSTGEFRTFSLPFYTNSSTRYIYLRVQNQNSQSDCI